KRPTIGPRAVPPWSRRRRAARPPANRRCPRRLRRAHCRLPGNFACGMEGQAMCRPIRWLAVALLLAATPAWAVAEQVRYRFVPVDASAKTQQVAAGPDGALGEFKRGPLARSQPYPYTVQPNQMVTFRHPFTGRNVMVPIRLPASTPRMVHRADGIIY